MHETQKSLRFDIGRDSIMSNDSSRQMSEMSDDRRTLAGVRSPGSAAHLRKPSNEKGGEKLQGFSNMIKRDFFNRGGPPRQAMELLQDGSEAKAGLLRKKTIYVKTKPGREETRGLDGHATVKHSASNQLSQVKFERERLQTKKGKPDVRTLL